MREGFMKEDYLATALSAVGEAVIAIDSSGSVRHLNAAAERLVGQSLAAVHGKAFRDVFRLLPLSDHGVPGDAVRATLRDGKPVTLAPRTALAVPGLADQQVNGRTVPLFDDRGRVDGAILVLSEASEESSIREELRVREERLKSIFLAAPVGIGLVKHQVIMYANDRLCEICGSSRAELTHQSALMLYPSEEEY
jgi:PAS domain-containing protein